MIVFEYIAMDCRGAEVSGRVTAESQNKAIGMIREKGLFPTKLVQLWETDEPDPALVNQADKPKPKTNNLIKRLIRWALTD